MISLMVAGSSACHGSERERALVDIDEARRTLARLAVEAHGDLASRAVELARESLFEAERAVRGRRPDAFRPLTAGALDRTAIAGWVVATQREQSQKLVEDRLAAARDTVTAHSLRKDLASHPSVRARVRLAASAISDAERALAGGQFRLAEDRAGDALALASVLPEDARAGLARLSDAGNRAMWSVWADNALEQARRSGRAALVVDKQTHRAMLWQHGARPVLFSIELGFNGLSRKLRAGDGATPEGIYHVTRKKQGGETRYYKALLLSYPNENDRRRFERARVEGALATNARIGGLIEIHGDGGRGTNWTDGCVALENPSMDEVFAALGVGSPVAIVGHYDFAAHGYAEPTQARP